MPTKKEAQKTYDKICNNLQEMQDFEYSIKEVQYFEKLEKNPLMDLNLGGLGNPMNALQAERILIDSYQVIFDTNRSDLSNFSKGLDSMYKQNYYTQYLPTTENEKTDYLMKEIRNNLANNQETYLAYKNNMDDNTVHANVIKYFIGEDKQYYRVFYNAGIGVHSDNKAHLNTEVYNNLVNYNTSNQYDEDLSNNLFYSALKYQFKDFETLEKCIKRDITVNLEFLAVPPSQSKELQGKLKSLVKEHRKTLSKASSSNNKLTRLQTTNNCHARCIREALRDNAGPQTFSEVFDFITNTKYHEIVEMLEYQKAALEKSHDIKPREIQNYNHFDPSLGQKNMSYQKIFENEINNSCYAVKVERCIKLL